MSELLVNTIKKADGTGGVTIPADTGTFVVKDGSNDITVNDITAGGIYLGGTAATNKLDYYEEGNFTPTYQGSSSNPSVSYSFQYGRYTRIGDLVYYAVNVNGSISGGSGVLEIHGYPFNASNNNTYPHLAGGMIFGDSGASTVQYTLRFVPNTGYTHVQEYQDNSGDFAMDLSSCQGSFIIQFNGVIKI